MVAAALWLGSVLVLMALRNLGVGGRREWLLAGALASALVVLAVADLIGPEAFIVRHDLARADQGAEVDLIYLTGLSDDAVPELVSAIAASEDPAVRDGLRGGITCAADRGGAAAWNRSAHRAAEARAEVCDGGAAVTAAPTGPSI